MEKITCLICGGPLDVNKDRIEWITHSLGGGKFVEVQPAHAVYQDCKRSIKERLGWDWF